MMATVRAKMYGEDEGPFAHVGRDAAAMVNRVNELRKWASVIPDLTKLAKLKCPSNITSAVRNLPADVAGIKRQVQIPAVARIHAIITHYYYLGPCAFTCKQITVLAQAG